MGMSKKEREVYTKAFEASKAKTVKERMAAGKAAVAAYKKPAPAKNLKTMAKSRVDTIEAALDDALKKKP